MQCLQLFTLNMSFTCENKCSYTVKESKEYSKISKMQMKVKFTYICKNGLKGRNEIHSEKGCFFFFLENLSS